MHVAKLEIKMSNRNKAANEMTLMLITTVQIIIKQTR